MHKFCVSERVNTGAGAATGISTEGKEYGMFFF